MVTMHVICPKMHSNQHKGVTGGPQNLIGDPNGEAVRSTLGQANSGQAPWSRAIPAQLYAPLSYFRGGHLPADIRGVVLQKTIQLGYPGKTRTWLVPPGARKLKLREGVQRYCKQYLAVVPWAVALCDIVRYLADEWPD